MARRSSWILILSCLALVLAAGGCGIFNSGANERRPATWSSPAPQGQPGTVAPDSVKPGPATIASDGQEIVTYPILGVSNKLTKQEWLSMKKWRSEMVRVAGQNPGEVFLNGPTGQRAVCLTFDDGPDGVFTPKVLDILKQYGIHGSFFCIGKMVQDFPAVARRADWEGNLVLNHTWDHVNLISLGDQRIKTEIYRTEEEIYGIIGKRPAFVRPPYGAVNDRVIRDLGGSNYKIIIWSIDTLDWSQKEQNNIAHNVLDNVRPGEIILMHSCADRQATVDALPEIITGLQARGYRFLTLSEMLGVPAYR